MVLHPDCAGRPPRRVRLEVAVAGSFAAADFGLDLMLELPESLRTF